MSAASFLFSSNVARSNYETLKPRYAIHFAKVILPIQFFLYTFLRSWTRKYFCPRENKWKSPVVRVSFIRNWRDFNSLLLPFSDGRFLLVFSSRSRTFNWSNSGFDRLPREQDNEVSRTENRKNSSSALNLCIINFFVNSWRIKYFVYCVI